ncbi:hypothetical protein DSOL_3657 [Desulfosporosinus metallidurans]|uniref:Uncharacterized protein n=1 Tax=Desulfosporosinus metallidurans TaxID=1888891 RepID=A0A1Q8QP92_9FIRM|nr:hypothetical protein DSOL_3657 [Desulfosporosinus metallidurans]
MECHLAPINASTLGIIGAGRQGLYQAIFVLDAAHPHSHNTDFNALFPDVVPVLFFLPALSLFPGDTPAHEDTCLSVGKTDISVPSSAMNMAAAL